MQLPPLLHGTLIKRYKRFLADITLDNGEVITAHVPNSGAMSSTIFEGCDVWVSHHDNPKRKLKYTLELTNVGTGFICTNTGHANKVGIEAVREGLIPELTGYESIKPEQKYGQNSRIDILLENEDAKCYVEIKSVTLRIKDELAFPDAVTTRGTKHLHELVEMVKEGHRAVMLYMVQRSDGDIFRIADEIDPTYYAALKEAMAQGVEVLVYQTKIDENEIIIHQPIKTKGL